MKVLYLDQAGRGLADEVEMPEGSSVEDFLRTKKGSDSIGDFEVSINREDAVPGQQLNNGDIISVTPKKYGGAQ